MKIFIIRILLSTLLLILVGSLFFLYSGKDYWNEFLLSFLISLINVLIGYYLVIKSINKRDSVFFKDVYGGMIVRMACVFGISIYVITSNIVMKIPFILFLLLFYVVHQWIEIFCWIKELPMKKVQLDL